MTSTFIDDSMEYEYETMAEANQPSSKTNSSSIPIVETISDDDSSYIEVEVTDDEDSIGDAPQLPPRQPMRKPKTEDSSSVDPFANIVTPMKESTEDSSPKVSDPFSNISPPATTAPPPAAAPPAPPAEFEVPSTPSKQRAKNSAGLSELSKQLRILQAKNESQAVDINRLERQLRILADLQGINVADLRKALEDACASEAFGELQHRVAKLRHELEAATLAKQGELRKDMAAPKIANLELRVAELDELGYKQKDEIHHLYEQLRFEREKSTRLESENELLKREMEEMRKKLQQEMAKANRLQNEFQERMARFQQDQARKMKEELEQHRSRLNSMEVQGKAKSVSNLASTPKASPEMLAEYERMAKMLREREEELRIAQAKLNAEEIKYVQRLKDAEERARKAEMDLKVEVDKMKLMMQELEDADGQSGLRLAQYKARFAVQDERIEDLEQQLESLYTAFTLLKKEFDSENVTRAAMMSNLKDADEEIARQANNMEKQKSQRGRQFPPTPTRQASNASASFYGSSDSVQSVPRVIATPQTLAMTPATPYTPTSGRGYDTHSSTSTREDFDSLPAGYASARPYQPTPERTPSTWDLLLPKDGRSSSKGLQPRLGERLISGPLIVESKGMLRKWKTKPSTVYLRGDHYQWQIGEKRSFPLQFGVSKVEFHPNHPLSFVVYLNPHDTMAPVVKAACTDERDYHRWMSALTTATTGEDFASGAGGNGASNVARRSSSMMVDHQEDADLQRIIELSKHDV
ncbi:MAG: hypothetical protein SGILL_002835 [Bacillariaceae sp.]